MLCVCRWLVCRVLCACDVCMPCVVCVWVSVLRCFLSIVLGDGMHTLANVTAHWLVVCRLSCVCGAAGVRDRPFSHSFIRNESECPACVNAMRQCMRACVPSSDPSLIAPVMMSCTYLLLAREGGREGGGGWDTRACRRPGACPTHRMPMVRQGAPCA